MIAVQRGSVARAAELVRVLAERNLAVKYRGSALGILWSSLNPLLMTVVYAAVFGSAFGSTFDGSRFGYATYVYVALVAMQFFGSSTATALTAVVANAGLVAKVRVAHAAFPVASIVAAAIQLLVGAVPLFIVLAAINGGNLWRLLLLPIPLLGLIAAALGVGAAVAAAYVYFRDVPNLYDLVTFLLWIGTPVFYPLRIVAAPVRAVLYWNPLYPTVTSLREIVLGGPLSPNLLLESLGWGAALLLTGALVFSRARAGFVDRL